jgi:anti-anti-sigma regulatory factor
MFNCLTPRANVLTLLGELTLSHAKECSECFSAALSGNTALDVDLLNVTHIDTAGLQLLVMLHREALASGKPLRWLGFSLVVQEAFELLDLAELLGRPEAVFWS